MAYRPGSGNSETAGSFTLHCRGDVRLFSGAADCTPKSKKGRALLAILAAEQRPLSRTKVIDLLWSDRQEEQARASLRTLLADMRQQFNCRFDDLLVVDRERIALGPAVRTDLAEPDLARPSGELFEGLDHIDPELDEWLRLERKKWHDALGSAPGPAAPVAAGSPRTTARRAWLLASLLLVAVLAAAGLAYLRPWAASERPVVAVLKFRDLTGTNALLADGIAEELRIHLAQHSTLQVIGRESSEGLSARTASTVEAAREKLGATHVIEGTVLVQPGGSVVSARLVSTGSSKAVWTEILRPQGESLIRSASQIASRLANNVSETLGPGSRSAFEADPAAYSDLFRARQLNGLWDAQSAGEARKLLSTLLERYPGFVPALALMAESTIRASDHPSVGGSLPLAQARAEALAYADRAIAKAPGYGLAYLAKGLALRDTGRELPYLQKAAALSPGNPEIHRQLARALGLSGDLEAALGHHRKAVALEPLSMRMAAGLEQALGMAGRREEIPAFVANFARLSDNRHDVLRLIQIASFDTGDLSVGYIAGREALRIDPKDWIAANNLMTMDVWFGRPDRALARARQSGMDDSGWTPAIIRRDVGAIERKMNAMGREFWFTSWAREDAAELLVANGRADALLALYERTRSQSAGKEPEADFIPGALISAVEDVHGRPVAMRLLRDLEAAWNELSSDYPPGRRALFHAYIAGYAGDKERALKLLEFAVSDHWTNLAMALVPIDQVSAFRTIRGEPRFQALLRTYRENLEREKRELDSELKTLGTGAIDPERLISGHS